ncbi:hypothetical protein ACLB2K_040388 [Fragaria x ananassa]
MRLDVDVLRYLTKEDLGHGGTYKVMKNLLKHKLLHHDASKYDDGFRLTYLGYDFLAIKTLVNHGVFSVVGRQLGVGKESDIFEVAAEDGTVMAMKLHRLGRTSFRAVKCFRRAWFSCSKCYRLDCNRHCVIMSLVPGYPLVQVKQLENPKIVFNTIIGLVVRLAEHGLIHCDFNEFNIMIDDDEKITMIDFPQMVSESHRNAQMYFDHDVECVFKFFSKRSVIYLPTSSFNMSFHECIADIDGSAFIEGGIKKDASSDVEDTEDDEYISMLNEANTTGVDSLHMVDQAFVVAAVMWNGGVKRLNKVRQNAATVARGGRKTFASRNNDVELVKRLNKVRQNAATVARGGRKTFASRNAYKDKGGKSSNSSKVQRQLSSW